MKELGGLGMEGCERKAAEDDHRDDVRVEDNARVVHANVLDERSRGAPDQERKSEEVREAFLLVVTRVRSGHQGEHQTEGAEGEEHVEGVKVE